MDKKLEEIKEMLIDKLHGALLADKITSTEQLLNCAKAYSEFIAEKPTAAPQESADSI